MDLSAIGKRKKFELKKGERLSSRGKKQPSSKCDLDSDHLSHLNCNALIANNPSNSSKQSSNSAMKAKIRK